MTGGSWGLLGPMILGGVMSPRYCPSDEYSVVDLREIEAVVGVELVLG